MLAIKYSKLEVALYMCYSSEHNMPIVKTLQRVKLFKRVKVVKNKIYTLTLARLY